MPDCSPTKWHRAHTTWFFEEFVLGPHAGVAPHDPANRYLFNSYYEAVGPRQPAPAPGAHHPAHRRRGRRLPRRGRPAGRRAARGGAVGAEVAATRRARVPPRGAAPGAAAHGRQAPAVAQNPLRPAYPRSPTRRTAAPPRCAGGVGLGQAPRAASSRSATTATGFAFDNEGPRHEVLLQPFALADRLVTDGEWRAFIDDGGYQPPRAVAVRRLVRRAGRGMGGAAVLGARRRRRRGRSSRSAGSAALDADEPVVHVSYYEADAYARWAGHRLPTEAGVGGRRPPARLRGPRRSDGRGHRRTSLAPSHTGGPPPPGRPAPPTLRRGVGVDGVRLPGVPGLPAGRGCGG